MRVLEFASTGAVEISVFQGLLVEKGTNPPRLAFWPRTICEQEVVDPPVPPPEPPEPPDPPEPFPAPPPAADMPPLQPSSETIARIATNRMCGCKDERDPFGMLLFFRIRVLVERG